LTELLDAVEDGEEVQPDYGSLQLEVQQLSQNTREAWCFVLVSRGANVDVVDQLFKDEDIYTVVVSKVLKTHIVAAGLADDSHNAFMEFYHLLECDFSAIGDTSNSFNGCNDRSTLRRVLRLPYKRTLFIKACLLIVSL
jgi:hypothetical protein